MQFKFQSLLFAFSILFIVSFAQAQTKVSGKVFDAQTNMPVIGASVVIENTNKGVTTDVEGRFFIEVKDKSNVSLTVSSIGYASKTLSDIVPNGEQTIEVALEPQSNELNQVTVTTTSARRESIASIYMLQKNSSAISDGISADVIRRSPDKNSGDVLKRVSGASIQENKFVIIRGLNERYNASLLNNTILPSTEADKKAFAFNIIPSSLIDNIVVYKSVTPDLPGDFSGGAVKISTKDYPGSKLNELSVSVGYNTRTTFKSFYKGYDEGDLDWLGFLDNSRSLPSGYKNVRGAEFINQTNDYKTASTKQFPNTFGYQNTQKSHPNFSVSYTGGNTKLLNQNRKLGYIYSVGYSASRKVGNRVRNDFYPTADHFTLYTYNTDNYDMSNNLSALLNLTYSYRKSKISFKNIFNNDFTKSTGLRLGYDNSNTPDYFYFKGALSEAVQNGIVNSVLEGIHSLSQAWTVDWSGSFGYTYKSQPDQKILTFRTPYNQNDGYYLRLSNENSPDIRNAGRVYSYLDEFIYGANANATYQFKWLNNMQKLKFGTSNYYRDRKVEVDAVGYSILNDYGTGITITETKNTTFNTLFSPENIDAYHLTVANIGTNSTDYKGKAWLNSGYVMLDNKFAEKLKLTWGVRVERYYQELAALNKQKIERDDVDVLPSLLFTYAHTPKTNFRLAASQSVNRPEFREIASYSVYDYENNYVVTGNPNLVRSKNVNADLRYEWFPSAGEIISATVFFKYFDNPIEQTNMGNDVFSYQNADNAKLYGAEIEIRKKLNFINEQLFRNIIFYANAAYMDGNVKFSDVTFDSPLQGQSPYTINGGLYYLPSNGGFSINVLYNRIGPRLRFRAVSGRSLNIFERPRDVMDAQVSKRLFKNKMELRLTVNDIFADAFQWYYKFEPNPSNIGYDAATDKIINSAKYGTTFTLSAKYNFGK